MFRPRSFVFTYSPLFALTAMILSMYVMAIFIGLSMRVPPTRSGSFKIFLVPAASPSITR